MIDQATYVEHALIGLGYEIELMKGGINGEKPSENTLDALAFIQGEVHRIAKGNVGERDLIG